MASSPVHPRDIRAKVLRSEEWWSRELGQRAVAGPDASGIAVPSPCLRGRGQVDVTYWGPASTGDYDIGTRGAHRHGYNEILWTRAGTALHEIDGRRYTVRPGTLLLIRRNQVHTYVEAHRKTGTALRFDDDLLRRATAHSPAGLSLRAGMAEVPPEHSDYIESLCDLLYASSAEGRDEGDRQRLTELHSTLLHSLILLFAEWQHECRPHAQVTNAAWRTATARRFRELLEEHFARHHDVGFYAAELAVAPASLRRLLVEATGTSTKELILDRVMVEAIRLLRFSNSSVSEIAAMLGFRDALYFSRVFKRVHGCSPSAFRIGVAS